MWISLPLLKSDTEVLLDTIVAVTGTIGWLLLYFYSLTHLIITNIIIPNISKKNHRK